MNQNETNEFSFKLKLSEHGIGVFAVHNIKGGTFLRLFGGGPNAVNDYTIRNKTDVPEIFREYCVDGGESLDCPVDFGAMPIGWYMNHSKTPNTAHKNYDYYAIRDIVAGEEILIDYNTLEEPEETKDKYYK